VDDGANRAYFVLMILAYAVVLVTLSLCVALLSPRALAWVVSTFVLMQGVATVGKTGMRSLPDSWQWMGELFNVLSVLNMDIEVLRPGCSIPSVPFMTFYFVTVLLLLSAVLCFTVACLLRRLVLIWTATPEQRRALASLSKFTSGGGKGKGKKNNNTKAATKKERRAGNKKIKAAQVMQGPLDGQSTGVELVPLPPRDAHTPAPHSTAAEPPQSLVFAEGGTVSGPTSARLKTRLSSAKRAFDLTAPLASVKTDGSSSGDVTPSARGVHALDVKSSETVLKLSDGSASSRSQTSAALAAAASLRMDWFRRLIHGVLIAFALFYLRLTTLSLTMLDCVPLGTSGATVAAGDEVVTADEGLYLRVDLRVQCFQDEHIGSAIFALLMLIGLSVLFPLFGFILLTRIFTNSTSKGCVGSLARTFSCCQGAGYHITASKIKQQQKAKELARMATMGGGTTALQPGLMRVASVAEREDQADALEDARDAAAAGMDFTERAEPTERQTQMYGWLFRGASMTRKQRGRIAHGRGSPLIP
jgi:hypothetical protein